MLFGIVLVVGPSTSPSAFWMARFNTEPSKITEGLFQELKESVEEFGSTDINSGVGLTTSEILILTEYSATKIKNLPQYISVTLYGKCDVRYTTNEVVEVVGGKSETFNKRNSSQQQECQTYGPGYVFDYREELSELNLDIVLEYAYDETSVSSKDKTTAYSAFIASLRSRKADSVNLIYVALFFQVFILGITLWYYSIKGKSINPLKERILSHILSLFSVVVFICGLMGAINLTWLTFSLRKKISNELSAFGFSFSVGKAWFICLWFFTSFVVLSTVFWSGFEWCISNVDRPYNDDTRDNILGYESGVITGLDHLRSNTGGVFRDSFQSSGGHVISRTSSRATNTNEEYEMQELSRHTSGDSDIYFQKSLKPSSTMYF